MLSNHYSSALDGIKILVPFIQDIMQYLGDNKRLARFLDKGWFLGDDIFNKKKF